MWPFFSPSQKKWSHSWPLPLFDFLKYGSAKMDYDDCSTVCSTYHVRVSRRITYTVSCFLFPVSHCLTFFNLCVKQETWSDQVDMGCMIIIGFFLFLMPNVTSTWQDSVLRLSSKKKKKHENLSHRKIFWAQTQAVKFLYTYFKYFSYYH